MKKINFEPRNFSLDDNQLNLINEENQKLKKAQLSHMAKKTSKKKNSCLFISIILIIIVIIFLLINYIIIQLKENKKKRKQIDPIESEFRYEFLENANYYKYLPLDNEEVNLEKIKYEINIYQKEKTLSYEHLEYLYKRDEPKISLIISTNNNAKYLKSLYTSIFYQPLKDIEIIFINDAYNNITNNMITEYMKLDKRIVLINKVENPNSLDAECEVVYMAKGKYILLMNSFDLILNNILEKSYIMAEEFKLDVTQFHLINDNFKKMEFFDFKFQKNIIRQPQIKDIFYFSKANFLYDKLIKKDTFIKAIDFIGFENTINLNEINEKDCMVYGVLKASKSYGFLNRTGYFYNNYMHEQLMEANIKNKAEDVFRSLFTVMHFFYIKTEETRKEKLMVGFKYFYTKIFGFKKYIKYLDNGFYYINEVIDLYLNSNFLVNEEKYYLFDFKNKIDEQKNKRK